MAERRYKPTPENERLVKQFIESSKRAGYDPTFTNIIVKEVKKDKTGRVHNRIARAQRKIEKKIPGLVPPGPAKAEAKPKAKPKGKARPKTTVEERRRRFRELARSYKKAELYDLYEEGFKDVVTFVAKDVVAPALVGGGLGLAYKAALKVPTVLKAVKATKQLSGKPAPKQLSGKPAPKQLPRGRRGSNAVDPDEIIPPRGPSTKSRRAPRKEPEIIDAEVVKPPKRLPGRPRRKALPPRQSYKQPPAKPVRRLEARRPRLEDPAEKGLRLKRQGKTLKQIAKETGKNPQQVRSAMRRRTGTHTPFRSQLGLKDAPSAKLEKFLRNQKINTGKKLRDQYARLRQELVNLGMPARARELDRILNLAGR